MFGQNVIKEVLTEIIITHTPLYAIKIFMKLNCATVSLFEIIAEQTLELYGVHCGIITLVWRQSFNSLIV